MPRKKNDGMTGMPPGPQDISLLLYLKDIAKTKPLTSKEEASLTAEIRNGDQEALHKLVTSNLRFVVSVARTYQNQGLPLIDLINEGNLGLIEAARRFDERKNFRFISYAVWWIRQAILQLLAERSRSIRLPLNRAGYLHKIGMTQRRLEQELMRLPTAQEIAHELDTSEEDIQKMIQVGSRHTSLDDTREDDMGDLYNILPAGQQDDDVENKLFDLALSKEMGTVLSILDSREREIIRMYFGVGYSTNYTLEEIGVKYRITRERVRQIRQKALTKLQRSSVKRNLRVFLQD
jgi:RNA polymerase primary sigma factor